MREIALSQLESVTDGGLAMLKIVEAVVVAFLLIMFMFSLIANDRYW